MCSSFAEQKKAQKRLACQQKKILSLSFSLEMRKSDLHIRKKIVCIQIYILCMYALLRSTRQDLLRTQTSIPLVWQPVAEFVVKDLVDYV